MRICHSCTHSCSVAGLETGLKECGLTTLETQILRGEIKQEVFFKDF